MEDVFLGNDLLKQFRRAENYETCGKCMFYKSCRGCPAVTYGYTQNPLSDNPLCFRELLNKKVETKEWNSPQLNTTKEQECQNSTLKLHKSIQFGLSSFIEN